MLYYPKKFTVTKFTVEKYYGMTIFIFYLQRQLQELVMKIFSRMNKKECFLMNEGANFVKPFCCYWQPVRMTV